MTINEKTPVLDLREPVRDMFTFQGQMHWDQLLQVIEMAMGHKLYPEQVDYIFFDNDIILTGERRNGKTIAILIKTLLTAEESVTWWRCDDQHMCAAITHRASIVGRLLQESGIPMPYIIGANGRRVL